MWHASRLKLVLKANVLGLNANKYLHPFSIVGVASLSGQVTEEAINRTSQAERIKLVTVWTESHLLNKP